MEKTMFKTHDEHYKFLVMSFELSNTLKTIKSLMNEIFRPHLQKFVLVFFNNILVYSKRINDHLRHL